MPCASARAVSSQSRRGSRLSWAASVPQISQLLGPMIGSQARRLYGWFYQGCGLTEARLDELAERFAAQVPEGKVCMAAVQEHLLRHRGAPEAAAHEVDFDELAPTSLTQGGTAGVEQAASTQEPAVA